MKTPTHSELPVVRAARRFGASAALKTRSAGFALALAALPVLAQEDTAALRPPNPGPIKGPLGVLVLLVLAVLAGLLIFASTLPSKRGHQD